MNAFLSTSLAALTVLGLCAAPATAQQQKYGTIERSAVDGGVKWLRANSAAGTLGDGSVLAAAKALTALGHCHRFYANDDGPVVRGAVRTVLGGRRADGSFASGGGAAPALTTQWAIEALAVMEPSYFAEEIRAARTWLDRQRDAGDSPWATLCASVRERTAAGDADPKSLGKQMAEALGRAIEGRDVAAVVDALVGVVACQSVARELDAGGAAGGAGSWSETQEKAVAYLMKQQENGRFFVTTPSGRFPDTGVTALALAALQSEPADRRSEAEKQVIEQGLAFLLSEQNEDGTFAERNANYTTAAAILALAKAKRKEFEPALVKARDYILAIQNIEGRGYARDDRDYGSIGYGGDQRGDLSNMQFAVQALREAGVDAGDESLAKALVFLQRTQNLKSVNDFSGRVRNEGEWAEVTSGDDGGAAYYPGNSPAGYVELPDGKQIPRSYGSMTYALLKTYTLAGVKADDPRVKAAVQWIESNWSLTENPGADPSLPPETRYQGLYYYYMVLAQALDIAGIDRLEIPGEKDGETTTIDWRALLREHLTGLQAADGSWVNDKNGRWWEDRATLCTIYALLALERSR